MRTFNTGSDLRQGLASLGLKTVWVEVDVNLLADLLGQRFNGPGGVVSMEQVDIERAENGVVAARPVIVRQEPPDGDA